MVVLFAKGVYEIPPHYVLKRWSKDAKSLDIVYENSTRVNEDNHALVTYVWAVSNLLRKQKVQDGYQVEGMTPTVTVHDPVSTGTTTTTNRVLSQTENGDDYNIAKKLAARID
ncbi:hypothetical protein IFM89_003862 [Coptis chinensis]|uniref:Protein FAR1-RELATED SEQUENCE n=1 Tax=Coptis chinensis TaxID=261450 RepID=A0A835LWV2_9MAGN|nr:hypothetical protein IFM89_003862 [Coptis chinensis]